MNSRYFFNMSESVCFTEKSEIMAVHFISPLKIQSEKTKKDKEKIPSETKTHKPKKKIHLKQKIQKPKNLYLFHT